MDRLWQDLRYSFRSLFKNPVFTIAAVTALALGIGVNTAVFSIVNTVLLHPLPFPEPDRLMQISEVDRQGEGEPEPASFPNFVDWREQSQSFAQVAAYTYDNFALTGSAEPQMLIGLSVSSGFFHLLDVKPRAGRAFQEDEDKPGGERVVIISHKLWQRDFGSNPGLIGQSLTLNGKSFTVIGVLGSDFQFPYKEIDLWVPLALDPAAEERESHYLTVIGRLDRNATLEQAQSEMDVIARNLGHQYPKTNKGRGIKILPLHEQMVGGLRSGLLIMLGAVGMVLLIACANVANLLLARLNLRQKEIAIRTALGASRMRLVRQFLTESFSLTLLGGGLGLLLAIWGVDVLMAASSDYLPNAPDVRVDRWMLGFTMAISILIGVALGLVPAFQYSRSQINESLKEGGRSMTGGEGKHYLRNLLVISELAISIVLLIGGGLLLKSVVRLWQVNPGFNPDHVLTMQLSLPRTKYPEGQQKINFFEEALQRIAALKEVDSAGATTEIPFGWSQTSRSFKVEGRSPAATGPQLNADLRTVSSDYFKAMGIPLLRGRYFTRADSQNAPGVAIINEAMLKRFWPDEDPLGKRIKFDSETAYEIVGIIGNVKHVRLNAGAVPEIYTHYFQMPSGMMDLAVRAKGDPENLIPAIRGVIREIDSDQPLYSIKTMDERLSRSITSYRFNALLLDIFAAAALILAAVGTYGVIAYSVTQQTREIGIRLALGAEPWNILRLVMGQGLVLTVIGVGVGLAAAYALTRVMATLLYSVSTTDPVIFISVPLLLTGVALLASYIPARRAMKADPVIVLRYE